MFAKVIVDVLHSEVDKVFDYSIPEGLSVTAGMRVTVPFACRFIDGIVIKTSAVASFDETKIKPIKSVLDEMPAITKECLYLAEEISKRYFVTKAQALRLFIPTEMRRGTVKESVKKYAFLTDKNDYENIKKSAIKQKLIIEYLGGYGKTEVARIAELFGRSSLNSLVEKGYVQIVEEKVARKPYQLLKQEEKKVNLTIHQERAIESITTSNNPTLIFGVTGSGKTEVYLNMIERTLAQGKTAIMLVPEIALTPQMLKQLRVKFGDTCAILHSGLSAGEKFDEWWRLRTGEARIAIGARSAIFAPLENLGLIVIDEEHDSSYQSETAPRYQTITLAELRANYNGAKLILGSATPSIETYLKGVNGEYNLVEMPERINKRPLPEVSIVDMKREVRRGNSSNFSGLLKTELQEVLDNGKQAIIFLNQRGYSKSVICTDCGYVPKCENCDISLTYHAEEGVLKCHYCNAKYKMIETCPNCGSKYLRYGGIGTERVVLELKKLFPSAKIVRMDRDTTSNKEGHNEILEEFSSKNADILVGTQMIAKGHDFPSVTLVGILDADMSLYFSDYRSAERTFQLITQVAGRSGRAEDIGKVILQTYQPENTVINYAVNYNYKKFFEYELSLRQATSFPPFTDIVRILVSGEDEEKTVKTLKEVYEGLNAVYLENKSEFKFFGCMKSPIKRIQNKIRYQVLMKIVKDSPLKDRVCLLASKIKEKGVFVSIEVNPNNLS